MKVLSLDEFYLKKLLQFAVRFKITAMNEFDAFYLGKDTPKVLSVQPSATNTGQLTAAIAGQKLSSNHSQTSSQKKSKRKVHKIVTNQFAFHMEEPASESDEDKKTTDLLTQQSVMMIRTLPNKAIRRVMS